MEHLEKYRARVCGWIAAAPAWIGAALLLFVLGGAAYHSGLFFDADFYRLEQALFACAAAAGLLGLIGRPSRLLRPRAWSFAPFAIAALYALLLALQPVSVKGTTDAFLRWTAYGCWTVLLALIFSAHRARRLGAAALRLTGAFLVLGGWAGWFGLLAFPEIVFRSADAELSSHGERLAGFLQYPNGYGAAVAFFALVEWQCLRSGSRLSRAGAGLALVPTAAALLATESRGATLALAFGFVLSALLAPKKERGAGLASAGIVLALSAAAARFAFDTMSAGHAAAGLPTLAGASVAGAALLYALNGRNAGGENAPGREDDLRGGSRLAMAARSTPGGLLLLAAGLAACWLLLAGGESGGGSRVDGHYETAAARQMYYADALRIFRLHPWLGTGGESWRMLVGQYQSWPYIGNEVHSGYLELLLDTGLIGLLALLALLVCCAWRLRKRRLAAVSWGPAAVLLAHSAIDFDWSYGFLWLLLLCWLALQLSGEEEQAQAAGQRMASERTAGQGAEGGTESAAEGEASRTPRRRPGAALAAALLLGFAAAALPAAWRGAAAARELDAALASAAYPGAQAARLRAALEANPAWTGIRLELASLLQAQERTSLLAAGLRYEPRSAPLQYRLGLAYAELGEPAAARDHLREALRLGRFDRDAQNEAIARMATMADRYAEAGRPDKSRIAAEGAVEFFEAYRELYRETYAGQANPWEDRERALFVSAKVNAAGAYALLGRAEEARGLLREAAKENAPEWRERAETMLRKLDVGESANSAN